MCCAIARKIPVFIHLFIICAYKKYFLPTNFIFILFQACKNGCVQHLEHLLFYGANLNTQNHSGNTPLHVCAAHAQVSRGY